MFVVIIIYMGLGRCQKEACSGRAFRNWCLASSFRRTPACAAQFQWWLIWFQLGTLLVASVVQYRNWHGARTAVMGALCVLTAIIMHQADGANLQRQVGHTIHMCVCQAR